MDQNRHICTTPTSSPTFDGSGNSYPVSPIRCPGSRHIRMMTPPSIYLICRHNSTCVPMLWLLNTTHARNIQVKFQAPSQPSSPQLKSASRLTHNASHLNTLSQLGFTSMEQSIEPIYKKLEQLGNLTLLSGTILICKVSVYPSRAWTPHLVTSQARCFMVGSIQDINEPK